MRRLRGDEGAVSILIAILATTGVLLGIGALVVDVGQIYAERGQLQNGADAAALAVAQDCIKGTQCTTGAATATASSYADANANDGTSTVDRVCGSGGGLSACPSPTGSIYDCGASPGSGTTYVEVRTRTRTTGGSSLLPPTFSRTLVGNAGYDGASVVACARAAWGPPKAVSTIAMTMSLCEWQAATAGGTTYAPPPPYPPNPPTSVERVVRLHGYGTECGGGESGMNLPGGFGWVDSDSSCQVEINVENTYSSDPGVSAPGPCATALQTARDTRAVIYMPVYDGVAGSGTSATYSLIQFAAFVVTGYDLPGFSAPSWLTGANHCTGNDKCVYGFFTQALVPGNEFGAGPPLGASRVVMIP
jgi:Putative Flp pilus-assembly TadE/G-like